MEVSVRNLKNHLSEYLRRTQAGEAIDVTSRGRPVGRLMPPLSIAQPSDDETLATLQAIPGMRMGNGQRLQGSINATPVPIGTTTEVVDWVRGG